MIMSVSFREVCRIVYECNTKPDPHSHRNILVYIRDSEIDKVLEKVTDADIPKQLTDRFIKEKIAERERTQLRKEAHLYMTINVILEDGFEGFQGNDLFNPDRAFYHVLRLKRAITCGEVLKVFAEHFKRAPEQIRAWPLCYRSNATFRPNIMEDMEKSIWDASENHNPWTVFLELAPTGIDSLPPFDKQNQLLVFFKYFDVKEEKLRYCGHTYLSLNSSLEEVIPLLNERAGLPAGTKLVLYEEIRPHLIEKITNTTDPIKEAIEDCMNGDIIIFEKDDETNKMNCIDFFKELSYRIDVTFINKCICNDMGFVLQLSTRLKYEQFTEAVAKKLNTKPHLLQFFTHQNFKRPDHGLVKSTFTGTLGNLFHNSRPDAQKKLYYRQLNAE